MSEYDSNPLYIPSNDYFILSSWVERDMGGKFPSFANSGAERIIVDECFVEDDRVQKISAKFSGSFSGIANFKFNIICVKI